MSEILEVGGSMLLSSASASLSASSNVSQHALDLLTEHLFDYQSACMIVGQAALETALMPCWDRGLSWTPFLTSSLQTVSHWLNGPSGTPHVFKTPSVIVITFLPIE